MKHHNFLKSLSLVLLLTGWPLHNTEYSQRDWVPRVIFTWSEVWANRLAKNYFSKREGVDWERDRFWSGNKSFPLHIYYPLESYY